MNKLMEKKIEIVLNHHSCFKQSIWIFFQLFLFLVFKHCDSFSPQFFLTPDLDYTTLKTLMGIFF